MALGEAILVCLTERPMSGYDLAKNFDASIGFFWRASHQQIYRELGKLREKGFVERQEIRQSGKPNRILHTITPHGRTALFNWSKKPCLPNWTRLTHRGSSTRPMALLHDAGSIHAIPN